jgi:hypothetical protein
LNNFFIENSFKSKLKYMGKFGQTLGVVGKPSINTMKVIWKFLDLKCERY